MSRHVEQLEKRRLLSLTPLTLTPVDVQVQSAQMVAGEQRLFFVAQQDSTGIELWQSDGTVDGTQIAADLVPGSGGSAPESLVDSGPRLFFTAHSDDTGRELAVSDGTTEGTFVIELVAGAGDAAIDHLTAANGKAIFSAQAANQTERTFWISDGDEDGTYPLVGNGVTAYLGVDDQFWFVKDSSSSETWLWKWDGDNLPAQAGQLPAGTQLGDLRQITPFNGGYSFTLQNELWVTDLTPAGTNRIRTFGDQPAFAGNFFDADGTLFFVATDDTAADAPEDKTGMELWKSDGSEVGTQRVVDLRPGELSADIQLLGGHQQQVIFFADAGSGDQLWQSDGTAAQTEVLRPLSRHDCGTCNSRDSLDDRTYFGATDTSVDQIWYSDATDGGTALVVDFSAITSGDQLSRVAATGSDLFFATSTNQQLWSLSDAFVIDSVDYSEFDLLGNPVRFTASVTNFAGNELTYEWDFGDNSDPVSGVDLTQAEHVYQQPGEFQVRLTVTDSEQNEQIHTGPIRQLSDAPLVIYDTSTGNVSVQSERPLEWLTLLSNDEIFTGAPAAGLNGTRAVDTDGRITKYDAAGFQQVDFGPVAASGLSDEALASGLSVSAIPVEGMEFVDVRILRVDSADLVLAYDAVTGELQTRHEQPLTTLQILSSQGSLVGLRPQTLSNPFDVYLPNKLFKLDPLGVADSVDFGPTVQPDWDVGSLTNDWTIEGSFRKGSIQSVYIAETDHRMPADNVAPVAVVEPPASIIEGEALLLDASPSFDPETLTDDLSFAWDLDGDRIGDVDGMMPSVPWSRLVESGIDDNGTYLATVFVRDAKGAESELPLTITIDNAEPTITSLQIPESAVINQEVTLRAEAIDPANAADPLTYSWDLGDGNSAGGSEIDYTFTELGTVTVSVTVTDDEGGSTTAQQTIAVLPVNLPPEANDDAIDVSAGAAVEVDELLLENDIDPDGGAIGISAVNGFSQLGAELTLDDGRLIYDPTQARLLRWLPEGSVDTDRFDYTIEDDQGGTDQAVAFVTVTGVNDAPTAGDDALTVAESSGRVDITDTLLANDEDVDVIDQIRITALGLELTRGTVELEEGRVFYNPRPAYLALNDGETDTDSFIYEIADEAGAVAQATVTLTITGETNLPGDFNADKTVDHLDIDLLCAAIHVQEIDLTFDLNDDGQLTLEDLDHMVLDLLGTTYGDANLDGVFDSSDLVQVFAAGQYEDGRVGNSGWATGDWQCDGEFDTTDLIRAFQQGGYVDAATSRADVASAVDDDRRRAIRFIP